MSHHGGIDFEPQYHIHTYGNPEINLQAPNFTDPNDCECFQSNVNTGSEKTVWFAQHYEGIDGKTRVKLYTVTGGIGSEEQHWYLRVDSFEGSVSLVCSDDLVSE